jgi:DNA-binding MltR family transcriptional regulator
MQALDKYQRMAATMQMVSTKLRGESERGCVVLAFAWMDEQLTSNLRKYLLPSAQKLDKADELLGVGRPIGDAATKIDLSFRLGLIQPHTHKSLHMFRRLRNDFAHLASNISLSDQSIHGRVVAIFDNEDFMLNGLWQALIQDEEVRKATEQDRGKSGAKILRSALGTRKLFEMTAAALVSGLVAIEYALVPIQAPLGIHIPLDN